jgi:hypothetical protein
MGSALSCLLIGLSASAAGGIEISERPRPGSDIHEVEAVAEVDVPPPAVLRALLDFDRCREQMPYAEEGQVVEREPGGKAVHLYAVIAAPLVSRRDYTIRLSDESDWRDGRGYLLLAWTLSDRGPPPRPGVVRVRVNEGAWRLEPIDEGRRTRLRYRLFTDPGGSLPAWAVDLGNRRVVPDVVEAVRRLALDPRYAAPAGE